MMEGFHFTENTCPRMTGYLVDHFHRILEIRKQIDACLHWSVRAFTENLARQLVEFCRSPRKKHTNTAITYRTPKKTTRTLREKLRISAEPEENTNTRSRDDDMAFFFTSKPQQQQTTRKPTQPPTHSFTRRKWHTQKNNNFHSTYPET